MPIHLTTGLPGSGKTLKTLVDVKALSESTKRPVYYHGINDLQLSWQPLENPKLWHELPEGSIIVIDECQDIYPVHETKLPSEFHVLQLAKHRHKGYDIFLISQHPMNIHAFIRRLIDKHQHIIRAFGMQTANVHEWNRVIDYPEKTKKDSSTKIFQYPKDAFKYYKSAEVHTIQRKLPRRIYWLALIPILLLALGYYAWTKLNPDKIKSQVMNTNTGGITNSSPQQQNNQNTQKPELTYIQSHTPEVPDFPHTAPIYKKVVQAEYAPYPAACVIMRNKCKCYTQQATSLKTSDSVCRQIVENGFFVEWQQTAENNPKLNQTNDGVSGQSPDIDWQFNENTQGFRTRSEMSNAPAT